MNGLLYFVPRLGGVGLLDALPLAHVDRQGALITNIGAELGPDGQGGTVFHRFAAGLPHPIDWHATRGGQYWIGWHLGHQPGPGELTRGTWLGLLYEVLLQDGQRWQVPVVLPCTERDPQRCCGLPTTFCMSDELDGDGQRAIVPRVRPEFAELVELARPFLATAEGAVPAQSTERTLDFCTKLLSVSYRLGLDEILALGLIGQREAQTVIGAALDILERVAAAKDRMPVVGTE